MQATVHITIETYGIVAVGKVTIGAVLRDIIFGETRFAAP
jgi:hypothetical protein